MDVLTRQKWFPKPFTVDIGETTLTSTRALRYLGVMVDEKLSFREHLDSECIQDSKTVSNLSRIMANWMEPRTRKRQVRLEVVHSVLLYGAEIWADILEQKKISVQNSISAKTRSSKCYLCLSHGLRSSCIGNSRRHTN
ncbi:uncharacterized protein LOC113375779 [Ctenocephalides felis]|uniref:uncharacterized protein LOC113375779 n=1 Tax=Ctenocephalides felis TaxID=7515 RepID=UPI000E6E5B82|nr:uncharacterized protein LOC113375779 [Ctenocephalides felis]